MGLNGWLSRLGIQGCNYCGSGFCGLDDIGLIPGITASVCRGHGSKKMKERKKGKEGGRKEGKRKEDKFF